ncbi:MAG: tetratricopeptide repeat protein [Alphaproteobacteria bacterium]
MAVADSRGVMHSTDNAASVAAYEAALNQFNRYRGDPVATIDAALAEDPDFAGGHILRAELHISMWERSVLPAVGEALERLTALGNRLNEREASHAGAIRLWAEGDWDGARARLDRLLMDHPRDMLALQIGHLTDFYHGDRDNLHGRIARAEAHWTPDLQGYGFVRGMRAFGLEECGAYGQAEEAGRHAIALEPEDCWAQHAVAHVMEMQARQAEGIAWMESRREFWAQEDNAFAFHNWWHTALYNLDQGRPERALALYDAAVRPGDSQIQLEMLDAVALLWRLHLQGVDCGRRWDRIADSYAAAGDFGFYVFNDMHAMMAFSASGREAEADAVLAAAKAAADAAHGTNAAMTRAVGLPILNALKAFAAGRYAETVEQLLPVRYRAHAFGGSHAQRDILHRTLIEAALRDGQASLAQGLTGERVALKRHCPFSWKLHERARALTAVH